jgi:hypothetical protein
MAKLPTSEQPASAMPATVAEPAASAAQAAGAADALAPAARAEPPPAHAPSTPYVAPTQLAVIESFARLAAAGASVPAPGSLTAQVRTLYESSDVPVAEIARLLNVTQRTLYRYVQRGGWARRYRLSQGPRDLASAPPKPLRAGLAKGAGGRFRARAEAGAPQGRGLKALDPEGAVRAAEACRVAAMRAAAARRDAEAARLAQAARHAALQAARTRQRTRARLHRVLDDIKRLRHGRETWDAEAAQTRAAALADRLHLAALGALAGLDCSDGA